jgi:predicted outer membrane repeat protein
MRLFSSQTKHSQRTRPSPRPRSAWRTFRPRLELLETRLAPAATYSGTFTVTSNLDDQSAGTLRTGVLTSPLTSSLIQFYTGPVDSNHPVSFATPQTIHLDPSVATANSPGDIERVDGWAPAGTVPGGFTIQGPVDAQGNNTVTISGDNQFFGDVFFIWGNSGPTSFTFKNINFQNFITNYGIVLTFSGSAVPATLEFDHCNFSNLSSVTTPAFNGEDAGLGGALQIVNFSDLTLQNCSFTNNTAYDGGAVYCSNSVDNLSITGCTFTGNTATDKGGAIYFAGASLTIKGTTINGNNANYSGGGLFIDPATVSISSSTISNNTAPVGADLYNLDSSATLYNSTVGDLYNDTGSVTLISTTVGSIGSNGGTITTPDSAATDLSGDVSGLVQSGALTADQGAGLTSKLQASAQSLDAGNITPGANQLNAFINQVNAFVKAKKLTSAQAQPLTDGANQLLAELNSVGARLVNDTGTPDTTDTQPVSDAGQLVTGPVGVYLDNADGTPVSADEQARFDEAIAALDATFGPYGVDLVDVGVGDAADAVVQVDIAATSAAGGAGDGVLGCTVAGQITLVTGWNWYTGADPSAIGADQYDLETIMVHELGHAVGLGHSGDANSVMYPYLASGQSRRAVTAQDLSVLESAGSTAPEPLMAAPWRGHQAASPPLQLAGVSPPLTPGRSSSAVVQPGVPLLELPLTPARPSSWPVAAPADSAALAPTGTGVSAVPAAPGPMPIDPTRPVSPVRSEVLQLDNGRADPDILGDDQAEPAGVRPFLVCSPSLPGIISQVTVPVPALPELLVALSSRQACDASFTQEDWCAVPSEESLPLCPTATEGVEPAATLAALALLVHGSGMPHMRSGAARSEDDVRRPPRLGIG